ncbi:MAG: hypothetical protein H6712_30650 [Myxococcales bacterium]|nr:hypothetical protein [Myxococcales bacterium]
MSPAAVLLALVLEPAPAIEPEPPSATEPDAEPGVAPEDPAELTRRAEQAFAEGRFEEVVDLAARAYVLTGDPRHLYAQALAERRLGRCREALVLYARLLARVEGDERYTVLVQDAHQGIKRCEDDLAAGEPAPASPEPAASPPVQGHPEPAEPEPPTDEPRARPVLRDPWGGVLLGTGLGLAAGGGGTLWALSRREQRAATRAEDEAIYADAITRAQGLRAGAIVSLAVGGALVTGAVIRYVLVARARRRSEPLAGPIPGGVRLGWRRSF